jgi:hypothetical protein
MLTGLTDVEPYLDLEASSIDYSVNFVSAVTTFFGWTDIVSRCCGATRVALGKMHVSSGDARQVFS